MLGSTEVDTSYYSNPGQLSANTNNYETSHLTSPKRAFTHMELPSRTRFLPPTAEPTRSSSPPASPSASPILDLSASRFGPLLSRASMVLSRRQSTSPCRTSPGRELPWSPLRSPALEDEQDLPSPAHSESSIRNNATKASKAAIAFADFFQGSSELVSGFSINSPRRNDENYTIRSQSSNPHRNVAISVAAGFLGLTSPTKRVRSEEDVDDHFLKLDIDRELFPQGESTNIGIADYDELRSNAERLFMQLQMAYEAKVDCLQAERQARAEQQDETDGLRTQAEHTKVQLRSMSEQAFKQEDLIVKLELELKQERKLREAEREAKTRSVRMVQERPTMTFAGLDGQELSMDDGASDEESGSESLSGSTFWSRPESRSSCSQSDASEAAVAIGRLTFGAPGNLRDENMMLKARVTELEAAVEGCLGLVKSL